MKAKGTERIESERIIGRNASTLPGWHVPRISRLINSVRSFLFIYVRSG